MKTPDGREIFQFSIGRVMYEVREPNAVELKQAEIDALGKYSQYVKMGKELPEGLAADSRLTTMWASILSPKMDFEKFRLLPKKHFLALQVALEKTIELGQMEDIEFFPQPNSQVVNSTLVKVPPNTTGAVGKISATQTPLVSISSQLHKPGVRKSRKES